YMSVWQTPHAARRTKTSPVFGSASSTSWTTRGRPNSSSTAALTLTARTYRGSGDRGQVSRGRGRPPAQVVAETPRECGLECEELRRFRGASGSPLPEEAARGSTPANTFASWGQPSAATGRRVRQ